MKLQRWSEVLASLCLFPGVALAANYYVAVTGSDANPGSLDRPFQSIQRAVNAMQPGDTTLVRAGTYRRLVAIGWNAGKGDDGSKARDGIASAPITLKSFPGELVVWTNDSSRALDDVHRYYMLGIRQRSHWVIEGFHFVHDDSPKTSTWWFYGIHAQGPSRGLTIRGNTFDGRGHLRPGGAIVDLGHGGGGVNQCLIESNRFTNWPSNNDVQGVQLESLGHQNTPVSSPQSVNTGVTIRGNEFTNVGGDCVQIGPWGGHQTLIENNVCRSIYNDPVHHTAENFVDVKGKTYFTTIRGNTACGFRPKDTGGGSAILVHLMAQDVAIERNVLYDNGIGISIGEGDVPAFLKGNDWYRGDRKVRNIAIRSNVIYDVNRKASHAGKAGEGIGINIVGILDAQIHHNVIAHCAVTAIHSEANQNLDIRNNIFYRTAIEFRDWTRPRTVWGKNVSLGANLFDSSDAVRIQFRLLDGGSFFNGDVEAFVAATGHGTGSITADPLFLNPGLEPDSADYRLRPRSPAIDRGEAVPAQGREFAGEAPDLGAFEFGENHP